MEFTQLNLYGLFSIYLIWIKSTKVIDKFDVYFINYNFIYLNIEQHGFPKSYLKPHWYFNWWGEILRD
jgi:hypothetical protein